MGLQQSTVCDLERKACKCPTVRKAYDVVVTENHGVGTGLHAAEIPRTDAGTWTIIDHVCDLTPSNRHETCRRNAQLRGVRLLQTTVGDQCVHLLLFADPTDGRSRVVMVCKALPAVRDLAAALVTDDRWSLPLPSLDDGSVAGSLLWSVDFRRVSLTQMLRTPGYWNPHALFVDPVVRDLLVSPEGESLSEPWRTPDWKEALRAAFRPGAVGDRAGSAVLTDPSLAVLIDRVRRDPSRQAQLFWVLAHVDDGVLRYTRTRTNAHELADASDPSLPMLYLIYGEGVLNQSLFNARFHFEHYRRSVRAIGAGFDVSPEEPRYSSMIAAYRLNQCVQEFTVASSYSYPEMVRAHLWNPLSLFVGEVLRKVLVTVDAAQLDAARRWVGGDDAADQPGPRPLSYEPEQHWRGSLSIRAGLLWVLTHSTEDTVRHLQHGTAWYRVDDDPCFHLVLGPEALVADTDPEKQLPVLTAVVNDLARRLGVHDTPIHHRTLQHLVQWGPPPAVPPFQVVTVDDMAEAQAGTTESGGETSPPASVPETSRAALAAMSYEAMLAAHWDPSNPLIWDEVGDLIENAIATAPGDPRRWLFWWTAGARDAAVAHLVTPGRHPPPRFWAHGDGIRTAHHTVLHDDARRYQLLWVLMTTELWMLNRISTRQSIGNFHLPLEACRLIVLRSPQTWRSIAGGTTTERYLAKLETLKQEIKGYIPAVATLSQFRSGGR